MGELLIIDWKGNRKIAEDFSLSFFLYFFTVFLPSTDSYVLIIILPHISTGFFNFLSNMRIWIVKCRFAAYWATRLHIISFESPDWPSFRGPRVPLISTFALSMYLHYHFHSNFNYHSTYVILMANIILNLKGTPCINICLCWLWWLDLKRVEKITLPIVTLKRMKW